MNHQQGELEDPLRGTDQVLIHFSDKSIPAAATWFRSLFTLVTRKGRTWFQKSLSDANLGLLVGLAKNGCYVLSTIGRG